MTVAFPLQWPESWPRTSAGRRVSRHQMKAPFDQGRRKLYRELQLLGVHGCVISCNLTLRIDGQHRTDQADNLLPDPGVAVYFQLDGKPMVMASDRYETCAANLRSVGLAIEHMRGLERHGGGHMMQKAFGGFAALPPPGGGAEKIDWRIELGPLPQGLDNPDLLAIVERRYRDKARVAHSDTGGDDAKMIRLNAAIADARKELV